MLSGGLELEPDAVGLAVGVGVVVDVGLVVGDGDVADGVGVGDCPPGEVLGVTHGDGDGWVPGWSVVPRRGAAIPCGVGYVCDPRTRPR